MKSSSRALIVKFRTWESARAFPFLVSRLEMKRGQECASFPAKVPLCCSGLESAVVASPSQKHRDLDSDSILEFRSILARRLRGNFTMFSTHRHLTRRLIDQD